MQRQRRAVPGAAVGVVAAAAGYPGDVRRGDVITGLESLDGGVLCFHAGTVRDAGGALRTSGGRVLCVTAIAGDTEAAREQHGDELWEIIACWTRQRSKYEVMETLGPAGVPCSAVLDSGDILSDRHLRERGTIRTMHHPVRGDWELAGSPVRLSGSRIEYTASPLLGEHTKEILAGSLGIDAEQVERLREAGVL